MVAEYPATATPTIPIPTPGPGVTLASPSLSAVLTDLRDELVAVTGTLGANPQTTYATVTARLAAMDTALAGVAGAPVSVLTVTANGATDAAPSIQAVLDGLSSSSRSYRVVVEPASKGGSIYLNSQVRISTDNTEVSFAGPILIGTGIDPDGFGGLSILGVISNSPVTITSGATRGSSKIVVASAAGISAKTLIKIYDADTTGGASAGQKAEMAQVVDVSGTTLYLDHPLYQSYTGTISLKIVTAPVTNSGFANVNATFSGQQPALFRFVVKMQNAQLCYFRNMHFRGDPSNSWSRECFSVRDSYRCLIDNSTASFGWDYAVGSTFDYGFTADTATECIWRACRASNTRHGFAADKGSAGLIYANCMSDNTTASAFDLHGGWVRDIIYADCEATASDTRNSQDSTKVGFLAGNTTFRNGAQWITYVGCVARGFGAYTNSTGGSGESAGWQVVDGCSDILLQSCRIVDSQYGMWVLSLFGVPIKNVSITGTVFDGITGGDTPMPLRVTAGVAPGDVDGLLVEHCAFVNCANMHSARIYGNTGNTLANVVVADNVWIGPGLTGVFPLDIQYVDDPLVTGNKFYKTRRGVSFLGSPNAAATGNTFYRLTDGTTASNIVRDSGGNTNLVVANNDIVGPAVTSVGTAVTSTGASVDFMTARRAYTTLTRPAAGAVGAGAWYYDTTIGKPVYSTGTVWKDAAGTTI